MITYVACYTKRLSQIHRISDLKKAIQKQGGKKRSVILKAIKSLMQSSDNEFVAKYPGMQKVKLPLSDDTYLSNQIGSLLSAVLNDEIKGESEIEQSEILTCWNEILKLFFVIVPNNQ